MWMRYRIQGMRELEAAILAEAKIVTCNSKLRMKDIMEWSTGKIKPRKDIMEWSTGKIKPRVGEELFFLPELKVYIAIEARKET